MTFSSNLSPLYLHKYRVEIRAHYSSTIRPRGIIACTGMNRMGRRRRVGRVGLRSAPAAAAYSTPLHRAPSSQLRRKPGPTRPSASRQCALCAGRQLPGDYRRHVVEYPREARGTILVGTRARAVSPTCGQKAERSATASPSAEEALASSAWPKSAAWPNRIHGRRTQGSSSACTCRTMSARRAGEFESGARACYLVRGRRGHPYPRPRYQPARIVSATRFPLGV